VIPVTRGDRPRLRQRERVSRHESDGSDESDGTDEAVKTRQLSTDFHRLQRFPLKDQEANWIASPSRAPAVLFLNNSNRTWGRAGSPAWPGHSVGNRCNRWKSVESCSDPNRLRAPRRPEGRGYSPVLPDQPFIEQQQGCLAQGWVSSWPGHSVEIVVIGENRWRAVRIPIARGPRDDLRAEGTLRFSRMSLLLNNNKGAWRRAGSQALPGHSVEIVVIGENRWRAVRIPIARGLPRRLRAVGTLLLSGIPG
jgi:hypothetical protein